MKISTKKIAFISIMCALANILGIFSIPLGLTSIHLMQLPIILSGLVLGSWSGGITGFIGTILMAYTLSPSNPYILLGNAILGFFTGLIYSYLKKTKKRQIIPQTLSVLAAYLIQLPYLYITDVYFMPIPSQIVLTVILPKLLLEDMISVLISHIVLYRIELNKIL
ncbi:MAG: ECF transporter S component [Candidatus Bathyarchaeia archaeon]